MIPSNIIVQAGGKGTRLGSHTQNKPKCLVPIKGKPLLYHLFALYPQSKFQVIVDHQSDVVKNYLTVFPPSCNFQIILASGTGTASGIAQALDNINKEEDFLLVWCDLLLPENFLDFPEFTPHQIQIGLSRTFPCRWSLNDSQQLVHEASDTRGVAGFFRFPAKSLIADIPETGECVRWLANKQLEFQEVFLDDALELGTLKVYEAAVATNSHTRFFNQLDFQGDRVVKRCIDPSYQHLIANECIWYEYAQSHQYEHIPLVYGTKPLTLAKITGYHPFEVDQNNLGQIRQVLQRAITALAKLHNIDQQVASTECVRRNYIDKTRQRVECVAPLIDGFHLKQIQVNGLECRNPFHPENSWIFQEIETYLSKTQTPFRPIHGDPTFSNMLYCEEREDIILFDPRGYFGKTKIFGDPDYDWAKLYYSVVGNYDAFNRHQFVLYDYGLGDYVVHLKPSPYRQIASELIKQLPNTCRVELLHGLIWLALTSYASDDIDSIRSAFYLGIYYLEQTLTKHNWMEMSCLPKTWFVDIDGVLVTHNGYLQDGDRWLENTVEFISNLNHNDKVVLTTSRNLENTQPIIEKLKHKGIEVHASLSNLPHGERIIINDCKTSGLRTAFSISVDRDAGMEDLMISNNPSL